MAAAYWLFDENISLSRAIGTLIIVGGVCIVSRS
jgi:drug/metabolite transporter (DMT)-like permease